MTLIKRKDFFHYRFMSNNKLYTGSTKKKIKREAELIEKQIKEKVKSGNDVSEILNTLQSQLVKKRMYIENVWFKYKQSISNANSERYIDMFASRIKRLSNYLVNEKKYKYMHEVDSESLQDFFYILTKAKYSARTKKDYHRMYNSVFKFCVDNMYIVENPMDKIKITGVQKDTIHKEAFTPEELKLIGEHSKDTYLYPLFIVGISTGLREGDICYLRWSDINLANKIITVRTRKTKNIVYIPIISGLYDYLLTLEKKGMYIFPHLNEMYKNKRTKIGGDVTEFLETLGIKTAINLKGRQRAVSVKDIHSLRHTFAYIASINNIPFTIVQSILGHMDAEMTKMYMNHSTLDAKTDMLKHLPNYLHPEKIKNTNKIDIKKELLSMDQDNWQAVRDRILKSC